MCCNADHTCALTWSVLPKKSETPIHQQRLCRKKPLSTVHPASQSTSILMLHLVLLKGFKIVLENSIRKETTQRVQLQSELRTLFVMPVLPLSP